MGATLTQGGATFRVWAPRATAVHVCGEFNGAAQWDPQPDNLMRDESGYWTGFVPNAKDGDLYKFYVVGMGSSGYKRDPYARDLSIDPPFPHCNCIIRDPSSYTWHDQAFVTPDFSDMIIYQLHVGAYAPPSVGARGTFLDVLSKIEHLAALRVNVLQLLPIDEAETDPTMGYNGSDYFSPDWGYVVYDRQVLLSHFVTVNRLLTARGQQPLASATDLVPGPNQLKVLIDLCHLYGLAVIFDVVYNHAGGFIGDDEAIYFGDRFTDSNNNNSLYFTDQPMAGGLSFALWNRDVRQFLINSAGYYLDEYHVDGFRYDETSALLRLNQSTGFAFCQDLTNTVRWKKPRALQNAEHWPVTSAITETPPAGAGFDVIQHDGLRTSLRNAIQQASYGGNFPLPLLAVASNVNPSSVSIPWKAVTCVENHDIVKQGEELRIPALADGSNARSWYARSRARVASALLLFLPGIPQIFMGQEFLEDKQWSEVPNSPLHIWWAGLESGDRSMKDHLHFMQDAVEKRRRHPALRGFEARPFYVCEKDRVIAVHRWIEAVGRDVVVVSSLSDSTYYDYEIGFPSAGRWLEAFNSDAYDHWENPWIVGNGGQIFAEGRGLHGFSASASLVVPANSVLLFTRDEGD
ncbi:alpha amylase C-terminal domain-containing protein [Bradyrhizobium sp. CB82]|uniref:alpha amylase C-terminal domain-containing protein n=1 Tax=Bradyrhizobium sp. CB82 TaxID=3039159 RepID=UPI0024B13354|nr:alpha amylase C-terminal domain-containing protein [Bradyrhizobium sp. CB82]WFU44148.1 alpha amylase C-terminal domain-containing protein [Bradyrhizobium sp. CB82]